mmetsp:Transcript_15668/g.22697  ORF Transcript_15668/g.22697 Transcript_15668/m.22697 type:complete len:117 (-) Transcript_15668:1349-1699(-)
MASSFDIDVTGDPDNKPTIYEELEPIQSVGFEYDYWPDDMDTEAQPPEQAEEMELEYFDLWGDSKPVREDTSEVHSKIGEVLHDNKFKLTLKPLKIVKAKISKVMEDYRQWQKSAC